MMESVVICIFVAVAQDSMAPDLNTLSFVPIVILLAAKSFLN